MNAKSNKTKDRNLVAVLGMQTWLTRAVLHEGRTTYTSLTCGKLPCDVAYNHSCFVTETVEQPR